MDSFKDKLLEIQYLYSKLFVLSIPRRKFEYAITESKFVASNTSRNTIFAIAFCAFASLLLTTGAIQLIKGKSNLTIEFILIFFILHPLVGILALRQFLWLVNGTEILTIENQTATIDRKGTFWVKSRNYELEFVDFIREEKRESLSLYDKIQFNIKLNPLLIFKMATGEISFNYKIKTIALFSNLHENEKILIVEHFRKMKQLAS